MTDAESAKNSPAGLLAWEEYEQRRELENQSRRPDQAPQPETPIKTVRFGMTVNTGNSSSVRLDAEADVPMGGTAESTLQALESWVRSVSPYSTEYLNDLRQQAEQIKTDIRKGKEIRDYLEAEYQRFRKVFKHMGIEPGLPAVEDLPF